LERDWRKCQEVLAPESSKRWRGTWSPDKEVRGPRVCRWRQYTSETPQRPHNPSQEHDGVRAEPHPDILQKLDLDRNPHQSQPILRIERAKERMHEQGKTVRFKTGVNAEAYHWKAEGSR